MQFNKLVRDKIPEIILEKGQKVTISKSNDPRYLESKLVEKVKEFLEAKSKEEIADVLEIIEAIIESNKWTKEEIETIRKNKLEAKGGFNKRIILENVE